MSKVQPTLLVLCLTLLAGCQSVPPKPKLPGPLPLGPHPVTEANVELTHTGGARTQLGVESTPKPPVPPTGASGLQATQSMPKLSGPPVTANLDNLPLPAFINTVYGHLLHVDYVLDPQLAKATDLVTLSVSEPQPPATFYRIAADVLRRYGVAVQWDGHTVNLLPVKEAKSNEPPILISGSALPSVPASHRPVFQLVQLHAVSTGDVEHWLQTAYGNSDLKVDVDIRRNAIMLSGPEALVRQAVKAIAVLDRPYLRGSYSTRLEPAFVSAANMAPLLVDALNAEGYSAATKVEPGRSIIVMPVPAANSLLVFAPDQATLDHVIKWAQGIDRPNPSSGENSLFYYQVQNTKASDIAAVLNGTLAPSNQDLTMGSNPTNGTDANGQPVAKPNPAANARNDVGGSFTGGGTLRVDAPRNALIFRGEPSEWQRLLPLIHQMDHPTRQVMIQVTIAEVTLDNSESYGLSWLAFDNHGRFHGTWEMGQLGATGGTGTTGGTSGTGGTGSTGTGTGAVGGGLSYLVDVAGANRAQLTALASDNRVTILSTPRLLVKSGDEASIDVGTDVPTLTGQTTSPQQTAGTSNLLQSIQYRSTGIILNVKPTVYSDNRIDLDISQEVSAALPVGTGGVQSPSISNRSVKTSLSLRDGGSVVLGGLVSTDETVGNTGIPLLKDIPILGNLFRTHSKQKERTELLIMIVPYIIDSDQRAREVTEAVVDSMQGIDASAVKSSLTPLVPPGKAPPAGNAVGAPPGSAPVKPKAHHAPAQPATQDH